MGKMTLLSTLLPLLVKELRSNIRPLNGEAFYNKYEGQVGEVISFIGVNNLLNGCTLPSVDNSRRFLSNPQSRGLFEQFYRKDTCERAKVWLETVFVHSKVGSKVTLKIKQSILDRVDRGIIERAGLGL